MEGEQKHFLFFFLISLTDVCLKILYVFKTQEVSEAKLIFKHNSRRMTNKAYEPYHTVVMIFTFVTSPINTIASSFTPAYLLLC